MPCLPIGTILIGWGFGKIPIHPIDFSDPADTFRLSQEEVMIQRQIQATDGQIDRLVYELYGLTEDEIKIVEGG